MRNLPLLVLFALSLVMAACGDSKTAADVNNTLSAPEHVNQSTQPQGPPGGNTTVTPAGSTAPSPK
jgi:hypothetical protein